MNRTRMTTVLVPVLAGVMAALPAKGEDPAMSVRQIIAVGEVQSAADTVTTFLRHLDLIDSDLRWSGGDTTLIQTGDLIDGGEDVRATLDLFMRLQDEASAASGRVIVLMGNHEIQNILGELRDVNPKAYESFVEPDSEKRRRRVWEKWVAWRTERAEALGESFEADSEIEAQWYSDHPLGWVEYVESMGPDGVYGAWLRSLPVAVKIDGLLFVHGGVNLEIEERDVPSMNRRAAEEIRTFDEHKELMVSEGLCLPTSSGNETDGDFFVVTMGGRELLIDN